MKLIHILALVTSMVSAAVSQTANPPAGDKKQPAAATTTKPGATSGKPAPGSAPTITVSPAKTTPQTKTGSVPNAGTKSSTPTKSTAPTKASGPTKATAPTTGNTPTKASVPTKANTPKQSGSTGSTSKSNTTKSATQTTAGNKPAPQTVTPKQPGGTAAISTKKKKPASKVEAQGSGLKATTAKSSTASGAAGRGVQQLGGAHGRRDPFVSPIRTSSGEQGAVPSGPPCTVGKRCLSIPDMAVHGTVKDINGKMMVVVLTPSHRMYLLSENDQILNGTVVKITKEAVTFREVSVDKLGHENTHDVVKKIVPSS